MKKLSMIFVIIVLILFLFSCTNLFEPRTSKVSVVLTIGGNEGIASTSEAGLYRGQDQLLLSSQEMSKELQNIFQHSWIRDIESLKVKINKFSYRYSTGPEETRWATPTVADKVIDLVAISSTELEWLNFNIPNGAVILSVAFEISAATITVKGEEFPVTIYGNFKRVVLINLNWEVKSGDNTIELALDLPRSIIKISSNTFILVPRFSYRWKNALRYLWAIDGVVKTTNGSTPTELLAIALFEGTNTQAAPLVFKVIPIQANGKFYLGKHGYGIYSVVIYNNITISYSDNTISISGNEATKTTFEHGKTSARTYLTLKY